MTEKNYNGWANYETWLVKLWIDNEEGSSSYSVHRPRTHRHRQSRGHQFGANAGIGVFPAGGWAVKRSAAEGRA